MFADEMLLADIPLFALLDKDDRRELIALVESATFRKDEAIFYMGDPGDCLYVVRSGKVEIFVKDHTGEKIVLMVAEQGDLFGELAIFDDGPRSATAVVLEDVDMLVLNRKALAHFLSKKPDAGLDLLTVMARRLRNTDELLRGGFARNVNEQIEEKLSWVQRLANFIAEFSGSMTFLFLNAALFFVWIVINLNVVPGVLAFDPFPFGLLTMAVSLEAIFLSIFVLLSQNLQSAKDRIRSDIEYEVNLKAELEVKELHEKVDRMNARILDRLAKMEKALPH